MFNKKKWLMIIEITGKNLKEVISSHKAQLCYTTTRRLLNTETLVTLRYASNKLLSC